MGGRPSSPAGQSVAEGAEDRRVLPAGARRRGSDGDPLRLPEPIPLLQLRRRRRRCRRRDHHSIRELVGDRGVDELELHRRLGWGEGELLLPHRPGLFAKPRISGHAKPPSEDSGAASRDTRLAPETTRVITAASGFSATLPAQNPPNIAEDHGVGEGWLGFVKRSFRTRTQSDPTTPGCARASAHSYGATHKVISPPSQVPGAERIPELSYRPMSRRIRKGERGVQGRIGWLED